ncbi:MAG: hypothetical protein ABI811_06680 [Acidobacteriota bacterium]
MSPAPMSPEEQVQAALKALADHDRPRESQTTAQQIFRLRPVSRWKTGTGYAVLAAAAAIVALLLRTPAAPVLPTPVSQVVSQPAAVVPEPAAPEAAFAKTDVVMAVPVRRTRASAPVRREVVTEFFSLMDAPPPFERGQLLRVVVPASTMRSVGLPVNPDRWSERIQADVLVGEEGMARAIRFVSYQE